LQFNNMDNSPFTTHDTHLAESDTRLTSSDIAIRVRNLGKKYRLYDSPQHRLKEALHPFKKKYHRDFWALKDLSFEVKKGGCIGIIGRNGSGKSTLLQIICGILQPTVGEVEVNGRVSALLELGAGFNSEFTGRDNVYLNGAIKGFNKEGMDKRIQDIIDFAEIGEFVDQPVKTYSSGMYVRLAFALAINVDPDIVIIDEALAVGDIRFQRKCFSKIEQFIREAKTILFVSHSVNTVNLLCNSALLIDQGGIIARGIPKNVTRIHQKMMLGEDVPEKKDYDLVSANDVEINPEINNFDSREYPVERTHEQTEIERIKKIAFEKLHGSSGNRKAEIIDFGILDKTGQRVTVLETGEKYTFFSRVLIYEDLERVHVGFPIRNVKGVLLFAVNSEIQKVNLRSQSRGDILEGRVDLTMWFAPGDYFLSFRAGNRDELYDEVADILHFVVIGNCMIVPNSVVNLAAMVSVRNLIRSRS